MKTIFFFICLISLLSTKNVQALTKIPVSDIYQIEDHSGNSYDIRDLQDGFVTLKGFNFIDQNLLIDLTSTDIQNIDIELYSGKTINSLLFLSMSRSGGDMGGG